MKFLNFYSKVDHKMPITPVVKYSTYLIHVKETGHRYFKKAFQPRPQHILTSLKVFDQNF